MNREKRKKPQLDTALSMPHPDALALRERVAFFQAVNARIEKISDTLRGGPTDAEYRMALKQIVDKAIAPQGVVDVFAAAGLEKPNVSILSDEFLAEVRGMDRKNLAVEALQKLLRDEVRVRFSRNAIKSDDFSTMLEAALTSYRNGTIEAAQIIEELIDIAMKMRAAVDEGHIEGLEEDEVAFYDALLANGSTKEVMQDDQLRELARLLVEKVRSSAGVDWTIRANAQARLRVEVKRLLNKYGYPPDQQAIAADNVLKQAELFAAEWSKDLA